MTRKGPLIALLGAAMLAETAFAQKQPAPKQQQPSTAAEQNVEQLLLLMDTDKNGKISRQEWIKFMEAEFDRLDTDKNGQIDKAELLRTRLEIKPVRYANAGK